MRDDAEASRDEVVTSLDLATAQGVWAVRSASATTYYVDLDARLVMRARGEGSVVFPFDDEWVRLVRVTSRDESLTPVSTGQIRVGERPDYLMDPRGGIGDYEWRIQRVVTSIERVRPEEVDALGHSGPDGGPTVDVFPDPATP